MTDFTRLRQDCAYLMQREEPVVTGICVALLQILDNPLLACPENFALVKKPELLGIGVPSR